MKQICLSSVKKSNITVFLQFNKKWNFFLISCFSCFSLHINVFDFLGSVANNALGGRPQTAV